MAGFLDAAARVRPPVTATDVDLTIATPTSAIATGVTTDTTGHWITITCSVGFNIRFGASNVGDPANKGSFPAGAYSFELTKNETHFKVTPIATGAMTYWRSSYT